MLTIHKTIIIGSGPAGYTAAVYTARANLNPLVFAGEISGGQLMNTTLVENWPGTHTGVMGPDLMLEMRQQAEKFGAKLIDKNITKVDFTKRPFRLWQGETEYLAESVIVATGATSRMLGVLGESNLLGRGVATCAVCDAPFYRDKTTFVVGGGDAAVEDTLALTKFAKSVTMLVRGDVLRASKIMAKRVMEHPKVTILYNTLVEEFIGESKLELIRLSDKLGQKKVQADGVFLAIGHVPVTHLFTDQLKLDSKGYLVTRLGFNQQGLDLAQAHLSEEGLVAFPTSTSVEGVFGAGDVVDFRYRQAITAAGMGCQAALDAERFLESR